MFAAAQSDHLLLGNWNGCCPGNGCCSGLEQMLSGVGTDVVPSRAVCWQKSRHMLIGVSLCVDRSFAVLS